MQNEAAAQNTKKARQQEEVGIMGGLEETGVAMQQRLYGEANPHLHALVCLLRSGLFISGWYVIQHPPPKLWWRRSSGESDQVPALISKTRVELFRHSAASAAAFHLTACLGGGLFSSGFQQEINQDC